MNSEFQYQTGIEFGSSEIIPKHNWRNVQLMSNSNKHYSREWETFEKVQNKLPSHNQRWHLREN